MNAAFRIWSLRDLPSGIDALRAEAAAEGFRFMDTLVIEWRSGANRFARPGEALLGAFQAAELIAIGGLNRDPYPGQEGIGRLRHIYVRRSARRSGVGSALVHQLLRRGDGVFRSIRLRTETREAADFYIRLGFQAVQDESATHVRNST
jgi:GNAT superfamily N-acetyltransferase